MTDIARSTNLDVPRETLAKLRDFEGLLRSEATKQNLISASTLDDLWDRHILDSAQLASILLPGTTCDVGSGAGLPGIVLAVLIDQPIMLIEPRPLRAKFLEKVAAELNLPNVAISTAKAERVHGSFDNITARAVASLDKFFSLANHLSRKKTRWILPKGRQVKSELDEAMIRWQGEFTLVPSVTSDDAAIVVAERVRRRGKP